MLRSWGVVTQVFRFLTLVLTALALAPAFTHVLEMPAKLALAPTEYLIVQQIYTAFGPVGSIIEPGAILSAFMLALMVRGRRSFRPALLAAGCLVLALVEWVAVVNPVNAHWVAATVNTVPEHFEWLRSRWEWGHVGHAVLLFAGFVATVTAVLADFPTAKTAAERKSLREAA